MPTLNYLSVALVSALVAAYMAIGLADPAPLEHQTTTISPLHIAQGENLLIWGGWRTTEGYDHGTTNSVEIICNRERQTCLEAYAELLQHDAGQDLTAQAFDYEVTTWDDERLIAVASGAMAECLDRILLVDLADENATLEWRPGADDCEADIGKAVLAGDPL